MILVVYRKRARRLFVIMLNSEHNISLSFYGLYVDHDKLPQNISISVD